MRYAVVVAPPHFPLPAEGSVFAAPEPVGPVCAALTRGGRRVMLVTSTTALVEGFAHAIAEVAPEDDLLVYIAASTTAGADTVKLRVASDAPAAHAGHAAHDVQNGAPPSRPFALEPSVELRQLAAAVKARNPAAVMYVVEAYHDGDAEDPFFAAEHVDSILRAVEARAAGHAAAVGVLAESQSPAAWAFTRYVLGTLAEAAARDELGWASAHAVHERLSAGAAVDTHVQSFSFVRGTSDFVVLEGPQPPAVEAAAPAGEGAEGPPAEATAAEGAVPPARESHIEVPISVGELPSGRDSHIEVPISVGELTPAYGTPAASSTKLLEEAAGPPHSEPAISGMIDTPRVPSEVSASAFANAPSSSENVVPPGAGLEDDDGWGEAAAEAERVSSRPPERAAPASVPPITTASAVHPEPKPTEPSLAGGRAAQAVQAEAAVAQAHGVDVPPPRASEPSLPDLDALLDLADDAFERKAFREALAGYKAALAVAPPGDASGRAAIHARIGEVKRTQGKTQEAERHFEKAARTDPAHRGALSALIQLAGEAKDPRRVIELRRKRLQALAGAEERVEELKAIADVYGDDLGDARNASLVLDEALSIEGKSRASLQLLRAGYEKIRRWPRVAEVLFSLAESAESTKERAALRFAAGEVAVERLKEPARGYALVEQALQEDPTLDKATRMLVATRTATAEWDAIQALYKTQAERLAELGDSERAWDAWRKLGVLRRDKLRDAEGAIEAFSNAVKCRPENVDARALLAEMYISSGDEARAIAQFERIALQAPSRSSTFTRLFGLHRRAGRTDRAWLAGAGLVELGAADMDQQLFVDQYRPDGPIRPARSMDDAAWDDLMRAPGADDVVGDILRAIVGAAVAIRVEDMRQARQLVALDPGARQSPSSTVSVVRSFYWAAQVLGVEAPDLYVMDDVPGGVAAVQAPSPATALGPDVLRGMGTKDLAFVAGRHLTYFRPDHYCLVFYPTLSDISALFLGAVTIVLPNVTPPPNLRDAVMRHHALLSKQLGADDKRRLQAAVGRLEARDGRVDLTAWIRSVELSAQRAGLLLCGDLAVGIARLRAETDTRAIAELTFDEKRGDLLAFVASEKLARARALLGVDARAPTGSASAGQLQAG